VFAFQLSSPRLTLSRVHKGGRHSETTIHRPHTC
jgi:hypothetical protein